MKIGIIGSGAVGQALGFGFASEGHEVTLGTRDPKSAKVHDWVTKTAKGVKAGTFEETAKFAELIVFCPLFRAAENIIKLAGPENFKGKIVIDTTNPIADEPPVNGVLKYTTTGRESAGELIQKWLPDSKVVKAFNSIGNALMYNPKFEDGQPTMFICGNDEDAKNTVTKILEDFGWDVMGSGSIEASNALEGLCIIWCARGFIEGQWNHAFKLLKK
jgi:8-hydroxy-5-deazaflavin:NADPH oxidoreductase